ncbi:MAG: hypothetical protein ACRERC_14450 [Candidatus Binatia bacterium]
MSQSTQSNSAGVKADEAPESDTARAELAQLQERLDAVRRELSVADRRLRIAARQNPLLAVGVAVAAGYLLGRLLKRI